MKTIAQALDVHERTVSARDAEVLLAHTLGTTREVLHTHPEINLKPEQEATYEANLTRREHNEPVAYITGVKEFYGRPFQCDKRALIPRPETEGLIERAIALLETQKHAGPLKILELGTGCGNISVTLALELAAKNIQASIIATDISLDALALAKENRKALHAKGLKFLRADLFNHIKIKQNKPYDLIAANLPYVSTTWKMNPAAQPDVVFYEPDLALFGGEDGLEHYRNFFKEAPTYLAKNGHILCEYGETQTTLMEALSRQSFPGRHSTIYRDYAGLDRIFEI